MNASSVSPSENPLGLKGIEFVEFCSPDSSSLHKLFLEFGFSKTHSIPSQNLDYYRQNEIHFFLNKSSGTHSEAFKKSHGPSISSMAWRFDNPEKALQLAVSRGAKICTEPRINTKDGKALPAIYGIGGSLIYFVSTHFDYNSLGLETLAQPDTQKPKGFIRIDHLTNNVENGTMKDWSQFYKNIFGFTEVRYFDIRGVKTGLQSFALKSPDGSFCIPINEATEEKSQINEYLREYKGPGIQHIAFLTDDIISSVEQLKGTNISTLDIDAEYYGEVFDRVPHVTENKKALQDNKILVDGDEEGYLLQIFTKNIIGPIFIEIIQRKNHHSFGEGNFGALFRSIERDQEKRGVFK